MFCNKAVCKVAIKYADNNVIFGCVTVIITIKPDKKNLLIPCVQHSRALVSVYSGCNENQKLKYTKNYGCFR